MFTFRPVRALVITFCLVFTGACATVTVRKVPAPSQYLRWTDEMQQRADGMEGFRFYLPRPFVTVFESFPIRTDIYIADGEVSPDSKYVIIKAVRSESAMAEYIAGVTAGTRIPSREIKWPSETQIKKGFEQQSLIADAARKVLEDQLKNTVLTGILETGKKPKETVQPRPLPQRPRTTNTGRTQRDVKNDNGAFAYQPMRGNFDIVYLPDFDEQYVVSNQANLGNAEFALNLGQGWSLQGFNSLADNSELNARIFDVIDTSIDLAKSAASMALGIPLPAAPQDVANMFEQHSLGEDRSAKGIPSTPVSLKIVVVHYAAKGMYPVIKPRELQERTLDPGDSFGILDLFKLFPKVQISSNFDPTAIRAAQQAIHDQTGSYTVPRYPYQYVSFNTFRYMAIEVVKADGEPFGTLYDKTGTAGDPGDRQAFDASKHIGKYLDSVYGTTDDKGEKNVGQLNSEQQQDESATALQGAIDRLLMERVQKAQVTRDDQAGEFVVHVTHPKTPPSSYTTKDRENLHKEITKAANAVLEDPRLKIELPPSSEQLVGFVQAFNDGQAELAPDHYTITALAIEANGEHLCTYALVGDKDKAISDPRAVIKKEFDEWMIDQSAGKRSLNFKE